MPIKKEFIIDHKGKPHVLYAGLLNAAHESGLLSIETAIAQIPSAANGNVAVCTATVRLADSDGITKTFTGVGDANPGNVSQAMSPHLLRMAETRAKARALRDAINVAEALADDPTEEDEDPKASGDNASRSSPPTTAIRSSGNSASPTQTPPPTRSATSSSGNSGSPNTPPTNGKAATGTTVTELVTGQQRGAIEELATHLEMKTGKTVRRPDYATLTQGQANQWIDRLEQHLQALAEAAPSR